MSEGPAPAVSAATGGLPAFYATCPNNINVNSDGSGSVYINSEVASVQKYSNSFYEVKHGDVTASVTTNANGSVDVTYNKRGVGNGVCQV